jgi:hypothetical protein
MEIISSRVQAQSDQRHKTAKWRAIVHIFREK